MGTQISKVKPPRKGGTINLPWIKWDYKGIPWIICQRIRWPKWSAQIPRKTRKKWKEIQREIENLNRPMRSAETELVI